MPAARAIAAGLVATALAAGLVACGSGDGNPIAAAGAAPPPRGTMTIAIPRPPHELDPLLATRPIDQLVTQQLYQPLVQRMTGPYDDVRHLPGLAVSVRPEDRKKLWRIRLRPGVRFQDGLPFDSSAVVANAARWRTTPQGQALLPALTAADAPGPDVVRLILDRPVPDMRRRLASPRLGIVSPLELSNRFGGGARLVSPRGAGTGPFVLRPGVGLGPVLGRNTGWWGTSRGLGPAFDQITLRVVRGSNERLRLLRRGEVEVAWSLPAVAAKALRRDPLLTGIPAPDRHSIGLERSVRGIDETSPPPQLSAVWLTRIGVG